MTISYVNLIYKVNNDDNDVQLHTLVLVEAIFIFELPIILILHI